MSLSGQLLAAFAMAGLPVLFGVVLLGSAGIPLPGVILVVAAGALVEQGEMNLWWVIGLTCSGAILGDSLGYAIGRYGGRRVALRILGRVGGENHLNRAEMLSKKWGGLAVFLTRWLLTPLGAPLNLVSGIICYPYRRFLLFDIPGEVLWGVAYVLLGELLSDHIAILTELMGQFTWVMVGLLGVVAFGWGIIRRIRRSR